MAYIGNDLTIQQYAPQIAYFNGTGSQTAFTLPQAVVSAAQIIVVIENVIQNPSDAYSVLGTTLTFTSAPPSGTSNIWVEYTSLQTNTVAPSPGTVGTASIVSGVTISFADGSASTPSITNDGDTNTGMFFPAADTIAFAEGGVESMRIDSSGNLLVGATTGVGGNRFTAVGGGTQISGGTTAQEGVRIQRISGAATITGINNDNNAFNPLAFFTSGTEAMRIDSSGNVRIGTTAAIVAQERASINAGASAGYGLVVATSTTGGYSALVLRNSDGNATSNQIFFQHGSTFVGSVTSTSSSTAYNTSSDYRLKENIAPMTGALNTVAQLKPCTYNWKVDGSNGQGFIAHELAEVVPDCVTGEKDAVDADGNIKPQSIDTSFLVATLTAAIQEQQAIIQDLKARIETLEAK
jgi:hypothetical protein